MSLFFLKREVFGYLWGQSLLYEEKSGRYGDVKRLGDGFVEPLGNFPFFLRGASPLRVEVKVRKFMPVPGYLSISSIPISPFLFSRLRAPGWGSDPLSVLQLPAFGLYLLQDKFPQKA